MKITLLCTNKEHPIYSWLVRWKRENSNKYDINLASNLSEVESGDILFLISCSVIVKKETRDEFLHTLVLHASDLPKGRGWSPHIWSVLNGEDSIVLSLLEAEDGVDTGNIWRKKKIQLDGSELFDEINNLLFDAELELIEWACENMKTCTPIPQLEKGVSYYPKRGVGDSELDISKTIEEQFNLLRVCDLERFPAFFVINGKKYKVKIERFE